MMASDARWTLQDTVQTQPEHLIFDDDKDEGFQLLQASHFSSGIPSVKRTFRTIKAWSDFQSEAGKLEANLDNNWRCSCKPSISMNCDRSIHCSSEQSEIRGILYGFLQPVNQTAIGGGNNRSASHMANVIRKTGSSLDPDNISRLILGAVVFKRA